MSLFSKNKVTKALKEGIANAAVGLLVPGEDYVSLGSISVKFGYIYVTKEGIEATLSVLTDKKEVLFGANKGSLMLLDDTLSKNEYLMIVEKVVASKGGKAFN